MFVDVNVSQLVGESMYKLKMIKSPHSSELLTENVAT